MKGFFLLVRRNDSLCYFALDSGTLMNDATILPCGHSFGAEGLKQVQRMVNGS